MRVFGHAGTPNNNQKKTKNPTNLATLPSCAISTASGKQLPVAYNSTSGMQTRQPSIIWPCCKSMASISGVISFCSRKQILSNELI